MATAWTMGVDLGGTKIETALVNDVGQIVRRVRKPTDAQNGPAAVEAVIVSAVRELLEQGKNDPPPLGVGVGVAGQVEAGTGVVTFAPNLRWRDFPLQANLTKALGLPVTVLNDVRAGTWGEWIYGAGKGCDDLVCIFLGTGIGGGIVSGGHMLAGPSNSAGELGHMTIDLNGPSCHCGNRGCLEAFAGGWAIARRGQDLAAADPTAGAMMIEAAGGKAEAINGKIVQESAAAGDPLAKRVVEEVGLALAAGAVGLVNTLNPSRLIIGGGVGEKMPELLGYVDRGVRQYALKSATAKLEILPAALRNEANVVGAAAVAMRALTSPGGTVVAPGN